MLAPGIIDLYIHKGQLVKTLSDNQKLNLIKLIHTIVWGIFAIAIFYICYAGIFDKVTALVWVCIIAVLLESVILLINKWRCPLTSLAHKYTDAHPIGFDIFIPQWLARHNKAIFTTIFIIGLCLIIWRTLSLIGDINE